MTQFAHAIYIAAGRASALFFRGASHAWMFPVVSGALLILSFHPFDVWPVAFVALAPLGVWVIVHPHKNTRDVFAGGCITGALFAFSLAYFTVIQFHWLPETYIFNFLVQALCVPLTLVGGALCGCAMVCYRALRTASPLLGALVFASLYVVNEMALYAFSGGYYFATIGFAAANISALLLLAGIGGTFLISFVVVLVNGLIVETLVHRGRGTSAAWVLSAVGAGVLLACALALQNNATPLRPFTVAIIQEPSREAVTFGSESENGEFSLPSAAQRIKEAAAAAPDLLIYPFSPVEGALYEGGKEQLTRDILRASVEEVGGWSSSLVPPRTTIMFWTNVYENGKFYNDFLFYKEGALVAHYRKRKTFPFIDYTPQFAQRMGLYSTPIDFEAGTQDTVTIGGISAGALLCSEIHRQDLSSAYSGEVPLVISAGSEAVFPDDIASEFSLKAAQFRAAEAGVPVVRANILGPSAIIGRNGAVIERMTRSESGFVSATIPLYAAARTPYAAAGNTPALIGVMGIIALAWAMRTKNGTRTP